MTNYALTQMFAKYKDFTMVNAPTFEANLRLATDIAHVPGDLVECGVWKGGMIAAIYDHLRQRRNVQLFDSFKGLPEAQDIDGVSALDWQKTSEDNCAVDSTFVKEAMELAKCRTYTLYEGWFAHTLFRYDGQISLLRLDADWYTPTMTCLTELFDFVVPGGMIIIDDYYVWDGCSRAVHGYLSKRNARERIEQCEGVAYIRKLE